MTGAQEDLPPRKAPGPIRASDFTTASTQYLAKTFPDANQASIGVGLALLRLAGAFQQASEREAHRPLGLRWTGFSAVFALSIFGRLDATTLARLVGVSRQAMSLVLANLERDGYIERQQGDDRRTLDIELTDDGRRVAGEALGGQISLSESWFGDLSDDELLTLLRLLEKVTTSRAAVDRSQHRRE